MYFTSYQLEISLNDTVMQYIAKIRKLIHSLGKKKPSSEKISDNLQFILNNNLGDFVPQLPSSLIVHV